MKNLFKRVKERRIEDMTNQELNNRRMVIQNELRMIYFKTEERSKLVELMNEQLKIDKEIMKRVKECRMI